MQSIKSQTASRQSTWRDLNEKRLSEFFGRDLLTPLRVQHWKRPTH